MILSFSAAVTATKVFRLDGAGEVKFAFTSTNWNSATITLTFDPGSGTYVNYEVSTDPTAPLTGNPITVTENLSTVVALPAGDYGFTVVGTPTGPIKVRISHKRLNAINSVPFGGTTATYDVLS